MRICSVCKVLLLAFVFGVLLGCEQKPTQDSAPSISNLRVINAALFGGEYLGEGGGYLIYGSDGSVLRSENGSQWLASDTGYVREALFGMAQNPTTKTLVATGDKGRLLRSEDQGRSWSPIVSHNEFALRRITFSEFSDCFLVAGDSGALLQSCQDGLHWVTLTGLPAQSYTAVASVEHQNALMVAGELGVWSSKDQGKSWTRTVELEGSSVSQIFEIPGKKIVLVLTSNGTLLRQERGQWASIRIDNNDESLLTSVVASDKHLVITSSSGAVYVSENWGVDWHQSVLGDQYLSRAAWLSDALRFVAIGNAGVAYVSDKNGKNWVKKDFGLRSNFEGVLPIRRANSLLAFGVGGQFVRWNVKTNSHAILQRSLAGFVQDLVWLPEGRLIGVGSAGWLNYSDDGGQHWQKPNAKIDEYDFLFSVKYLPKSKVLLAAGPPGVILRSIDNGLNWETALRTANSTDGYFHNLIVDREREWALAVAGPGYVQFSKDAGLTWSVAEADTSQHWFNVAQNPISGVFVAVGQSGIIQRSEDGLHWQKQVLAIDKNVQAVTFHAGSGRWFIGAQGGGMWVSEDDGRTWTIQLEAEGQNIYHITSINEQRLLACGSGGLLLLSKDSGDTWQLIELDLDETLRAPVLAKNGTVFLSTRGGNVLYSKDLGETWLLMRTRTAESLKVIALSPNDETLVAAGNRIVQMKKPR